MPTSSRETNQPLTRPISVYQNLYHQVDQAGLFARTYYAHTITSIITLAGILCVFFVIYYNDTWWVQVANAIMASFFTVQLGLLGHDLSHQGVFRSHRLNKLCAILVWGLGCGLSEGRWYHKHNAHHQAPNHIGHDPDIEIPFVFDHNQATGRSAFAKRWLLPYQPFLFWTGLWFVYPYNLLHSLRYVLKTLSWRDIGEITLMAIHFVVLFVYTFSTLPTTIALMFNAVVFLTIGIYMGLIFAPNHKGEVMFAPEQTYNWVYQIIATRNINPSFLTSYICGGLNYQIEHHLFPTMSRFHYPQASQLVQRFCTQEGIPYQQTSWLDSLREIHQALEAEAAAWR